MMKRTFERNEGKHARCSTVATNEKPKGRTMTRRQTRFMLVETIRILVITLFLFAVATGDSIFFPFVIVLAVTGLLSLLEYEADDLE